MSKPRRSQRVGQRTVIHLPFARRLRGELNTIAGTEWHILNKPGARQGRVLELQLTGAAHAAGSFGDIPVMTPAS